jgi:hypothetical protein
MLFTFNKQILELLAEGKFVINGKKSIGDLQLINS